METTNTYSKGETVEEEGNYICVPCGYRRHFKKGDHFTECLSCFSGSKAGHEDYVEGLELWEKASDAVPPAA